MSAQSSPYYYTQGSFWGGATASKLIYIILAIFPITGFLGLDHLYLHSPGTFILKAVLNICTFGYWYFHDVMQSIAFEKESVAEKGLAVPWFGPAGIGAGAFKGEGGATTEAPQNSLMYMAYVLSAMFIPFGLDYVIAGDYLGAVFKYMSIFMFGIGLLYGVFNVYKIVMKPETVFCEGTYRYPPFSWLFAGTNPDVNFTTKTGCPERPADGGSISVLEFLRGAARSLDRIPVVGPKLAAPVDAAVVAVEGAIATAETVKATVEGAVETATVAVETAKGAVKTAQGVATTVSSAVTPGALAARTRRAIEEAGKPTVQTGGGDAAATNPLMIATVALLFITSAYITLQKTFKRVKETFMDAPPLVMGAAEPKGKIGNDKKENVGELPPGPSESELL